MPLLTVRDLQKRYGAVIALRSGNLSVEPGEIHALLGANGAGKSTMVKLLTGVIRPTAGSIELQGSEVHLQSPRAAQRAGLAAVFQDSALAPDLSRPQPAGRPASGQIKSARPACARTRTTRERGTPNATASIASTDAQSASRKSRVAAESRAKATVLV